MSYESIFQYSIIDYEPILVAPKSIKIGEHQGKELYAYVSDDLIKEKLDEERKRLEKVEYNLNMITKKNLYKSLIILL